ncbi:hypothetical protein LCGC14_1177350 [marine sediment metagenome]|uniref:Uncharacterized protein n=1 Tax=marine sediment metagenome TaxID=412755 RepID=A0A0F9P625_9ZZZZ
MTYLLLLGVMALLGLAAYIWIWAIDGKRPWPPPRSITQQEVSDD